MRMVWMMAVQLVQLTDRQLAAAGQMKGEVRLRVGGG